MCGGRGPPGLGARHTQRRRATRARQLRRLQRRALQPPAPPERSKAAVFAGLPSILNLLACSRFDFTIFLDEQPVLPTGDRDTAEVWRDLALMLPTYTHGEDSRAADADVVLRYEASGLDPSYIKVKLIQKNDSSFPIVSLLRDLQLAGSSALATIKTYQEDWFGEAATVIEMDGELDLSTQALQLGEIEDNLEGLLSDSPKELTNAMMQLKHVPGALNGTGLLQTIIAVQLWEKLREVVLALDAEEQVVQSDVGVGAVPDDATPAYMKADDLGWDLMHNQSMKMLQDPNVHIVALEEMLMACCLRAEEAAMRWLGHHAFSTDPHDLCRFGIVLDDNGCLALSALDRPVAGYYMDTPG